MKDPKFASRWETSQIMLNKQTPIYSTPALILLNQAQTCCLRIWLNSSSPAWDNREYRMSQDGLFHLSGRSRLSQFSCVTDSFKSRSLQKVNKHKVQRNPGILFSLSTLLVYSNALHPTGALENIGEGKWEGLLQLLQSATWAIDPLGKTINHGERIRGRDKLTRPQSLSLQSTKSHRCNYCLMTTTATAFPFPSTENGKTDSTIPLSTLLEITTLERVWML